MKQTLTERPCKNCSIVVPYVKRRTLCINCYKLKAQLHTYTKCLFIDEGND